MAEYRLGGWTRVWIVLSALWCVGTFVRALAEYPSEAYYLRQAYAFIAGVPDADSAFRASMFEMAAFNSRPDQLASTRNAWWMLTSIEAVTPPLFLALVFGIVSWVRSGFGPRRPGVRTIEAEIEDP